MTTAESVNVVKEQIKRVQEACQVLNEEVKEMAEWARMGESLNDDFIFEEEEEEMGGEEQVQRNEEEHQSGTEGESGECVQQGEDDMN